MVRDSMVFYRSFADAIKELDDDDQLDAFWNIVSYALDGIEPDKKGPARAVYLMAKPQIDTNNKRYTSGKQPKCKQTGSEMEANREQTISKPESNENVNVNVNVNENVNANVNENENGNEKKKKTFIPPAPEDVSTYCQEKGFDIDPEAFVDFYASKGWMIGKNKMIDWKAAVRTWVRSQRPKRQEKTAEPNVFDEWRNA